MNSIVRKLTALSLAAVMGLGLAACGGGGGDASTATPAPGAPTGAPASYADQIVVGITAEPKAIEPNAPGVGPAEVQVSQQIFEGLVRTGEDGSIQPVLATDWTISEDGLTYTFHLREGLKWSDGTPLTAHDFVYSWQRAVDPATGADYAYMFECIAGYTEAINGEEYVAPAADASSASTSESAAESVSASTSESASTSAAA